MKLHSKGIIKKLDDLVAYMVKERDNWTCVRCGHEFPEEYGVNGLRKAPGLDWSHIFGRRHHSTRWRLDAALSICCGCHTYFHDRPLEFEKFCRRRLGNAHYDLLKAISHEPLGGDKEALYIALKTKAKYEGIL